MRRVKTYFTVVLFALLAASLVHQQLLSDENDKLQAQKRQLRKALNVLTEQNRLTEQAYHALSETQFQIEGKKKAAIKRIRSRPKTDDGAIAPVLREELEAL